jgi:hypothetical protein
MSDSADKIDSELSFQKAVSWGWLAALQRLKGFETDGLAGWKFTGKCDALPLGAMLVTGEPVPEQVAIALGVMLSRKKHTRGPRLKLVQPPPSRTFSDHMNRLIRMRDAREEYLRLMQEGGSHKNIVLDLADKFGVKRTWITDAIALDDEKFIEALTESTTRPKRRR